MPARISRSNIQHETISELFFYKRKVYELTKLYDEGRLWKVIVTADERYGKAEEGLKNQVRMSVLNPASKGITIEYRV